MANIKRITIGGDTLNLENYVESSSLAAVATSGSYVDLINKPSIPTKTSDLTNEVLQLIMNFLQKILR